MSSSSHVWQRAVPVLGVRVWTHSFRLLIGLAALGTVLAAYRLVSPLGPLAGMSDAYAWGVWKTFNVMTLTALGSGGLAVGLAAWVANRHALHNVMRIALVTSFLFYASGLMALVIDVGRPWNFYNILLPWRWNTHSLLFEVSLAMPVYCFVFLLFENVPLILERWHYIGSPETRAFIRRLDPYIRRLYPYMIAGAYLLPMGHQSSLGALMMLAGTKLHPLWQTQWLPLLYLMQAVICGFALVTFITMASCLMWRRPLDTAVLAELANWTSWTSLAWIGLRAVDLLSRGVLADTVTAGAYSLVFWTETLLVAVPAVLFRIPRYRTTPQWIFRLVSLTIAGGMVYRFVPTTIAFSPVAEARYFPAIPELLMTVGGIAVALAAYTVCVKRFAVIPSPLSMWRAMVVHDRRTYPHISRDDDGNPIDD
ncbi:NrfD/PsrC family molybdoenzyme membrane anchor subunit [Gemmatimonas sp.]